MIKVELVDHTANPEEAVAVAARSCFEDADYPVIRGHLRRADVDRILATVIAKGHHSVLEHAVFTFAISGISRVLSHQLVRHRIASYSQLSQQRSDASSLDFIIPPEVRKSNELKAEFTELMQRCQDLYRTMIGRQIPLGSARYALPSAFTTRVVMTMNARSLFNLLAQRECAAEEWEFRQLAACMHKELMEVAPGLFRYAGTSCLTHQVCREGDIGLGCGRMLQTGALVTNTREEILDIVEAKNANYSQDYW